MKAAQEKQSEQGQVSAPGESPKDVNQNTYTEEETSLAAKYKVEPKLVRLLDELIEEKLAPPEQAEEQEQPKEPCIDQQTQERLKSFYKNLDPRTKLAIATLSELQALEGINFQIRKGEKRLFDQVWSDIESVCIKMFHDPEIIFEDVWLAGVWETCRMVIQNT